MPPQMAAESPASMVHATSEFPDELGGRFIRYARVDTQGDGKSGPKMPVSDWKPLEGECPQTKE